MRLDDLFNAGALVAVKIGRWSARLQAEAKDLGSNDEERITDGMTLPRYKLAEKDVFKDINSIIHKVRDAIKANATVFPMIRGAFYIKQDNVKRLDDRLKALAPLFEVTSTMVADQVAELKARALARQRAALVEMNAPPEAIEEALKRIAAAYPSRDDILNSYHLSWIFYKLSSDQLTNDLEGEREKVKSIMGDMIGRFRDETAKRVDELMKVVSKGGKIPTKSINSTRELISRLREINVTEDAVLENQFLILEKLCNSAADMNQKEIEGTLESVKNALETGLEEATAQAEASLTQLTQRRFSVARPGPAPVLEDPPPPHGEP